MTVGEVLVKLGVDATQFAAGFSKAEHTMERFGTKVFYMGARITAGFSVPLGAALGTIGKIGLEFDKAMTESLAIMEGITPEIRAAMEGVARDIAKTTKFSASEAAAAYYHLASAGMDAAQSMKALPVVAKFAQAGLMDMAKSSEFLAAATAALGLKSKDAEENMRGMQRVADVLTEANNRALGTIEDFANALTNKAGASLRLVNKDIEEGVAVLAAYAERGIKGKTAGQQLWMMMRDLQVKAVEKADAFKKAGIAVFDAAGNMRHMAAILRDFQRALDGSNDAQKTQLFQLLNIPARSRAATMAVMDMSDAIIAHDNALRAAGGTTEKVAQRQVQALITQLGILKKLFVDSAITLFNTFVPVINERIIPAIKDFHEWIDRLIGKIKNLSPATKEFILIIAGAAVALGPALSMFGAFVLALTPLMRMLQPLISLFGLLAKGVGLLFGGSFTNAAGNVVTLATVMQRLAGTLAFISRTITILAGPWGWLLAAVITLWPAIVRLGEAFKPFGKILAEMSSPLTNFIKLLGTDLAAAVTDTIPILANLFSIIQSGAVLAVDKLIALGKEFGSFIADIGRYMARDFQLTIEDTPALRSMRDMLKSAPFSGYNPDQAMGTTLPQQAASGTYGGMIMQKVGINYNQISQDLDKFIASHQTAASWFHTIRDVTAEWAANLRMVVDEQKTLNELAAQTIALYEQAFEKRPTMLLPEPLKPGMSFKQARDMWEMSDADFRKAVQRQWDMNDEPNPFGGYTKPSGDQLSYAKKLAQKTREIFDEIMGTGGLNMNAIEKVWATHRSEIEGNAGAVNALWLHYQKARTEIINTTGSLDNLNPELERLFENQIKTAAMQQRAKETFNEWAVTFSDSAVKFETDIDKIEDAWNSLSNAGKKEFIERNATTLQEIMDRFGEFGPDVQRVVLRIQDFWKSMEAGSPAAKRAMEAVKREISQALKDINAVYEDKLYERQVFSLQYADREIVGLKRGLQKQRVEYEKHFKVLLGKAATLVGTSDFQKAWEDAWNYKETFEKVLAEEGRIGLLRIAQAAGVSDRILRNERKFTDEFIKELIERKMAARALAEELEDMFNMASGFSAMMRAFGAGGFADMLDSLIGSAQQVGKGMEQILSAENMQQMLTGYMGLISGIVNGFKQLSNTVGRGNRAMGGAMLGAMIGSIIPGVGTAVGALVGAVVGAIMKDPLWKRVQDSWSKKLGFAISEGTAKAITEARKQFGGNIDAAMTFNIDKLIGDAGGLNTDNFDTFAKLFRDTFSYLEIGVVDTATAMQNLNKNFGTFAEHVANIQGLAPATFRELIGLVRQFGMRIQSVVDFTISEATKAGEAWATMLKDVGKNGSVEWERLGRLVLQTFNAVIANGGTWAEAIRAVQPALSELVKKMEEFGFSTKNAGLNLLLVSGKMLENFPQLMSEVDALTIGMSALSKMNVLDPQSIMDIAAQLGSMWPQLLEAAKKSGGGMKEAILPIIPLLQMLREAAREQGVELDANTLKLIAQAEAMGLLKEPALDVTGILAQGFAALLTGLGIEVPAAIQAMVDGMNNVEAAATAAAGQAEEDWVNAGKNAWQYWKDGAEGAFGYVYDESTGTWKKIVVDARSVTTQVEKEFDKIDIDPIVIKYWYKKMNDIETPNGEAPETAHGGVVMGPQVRLVGEAGPEAIVPLDRLFDEVRHLVDVSGRGSSVPPPMIVQIHEGAIQLNGVQGPVDRAVVREIGHQVLEEIYNGGKFRNSWERGTR